MLVKYKIPKTILWVINLLLIFLLIFTIFRLATFFALKPLAISFGEVIPSFLMGIRYDLRWIAFILLPVIVLSLSPKLSPFFSARNKKWWTWYLAVVTFIVFFFFAAGFGSFFYNKTPFYAGAMDFLEDSGVPLKKIFQNLHRYYFVNKDPNWDILPLSKKYPQWPANVCTNVALPRGGLFRSLLDFTPVYHSIFRGQFLFSLKLAEVLLPIPPLKP